MRAHLRHSANQKRMWWVVDATGWRVGRLASHIARVLQGKHKPSYVPGADVGDNVLVLNADKVTFSGNKMEDKLYRWHTGYPGGLKEVPAKRWQRDHPDRLLRIAVRGMLPRNRLRRARANRLQLVVGEEHPFRGQLAENPYKLNLARLKRGTQADSDLPETSGYFVELVEEDGEVKLKAEFFQPEKEKEKQRERREKQLRKKALKNYLLGRGERPDFLPQPEGGTAERIDAVARGEGKD